MSWGALIEQLIAADMIRFGGAHQAGGGTILWAAVYLGLAGAAAVALFARRDL